jgi:hypothetical protein
LELKIDISDIIKSNQNELKRIIKKIVKYGLFFIKDRLVKVPYEENNSTHDYFNSIIYLKKKMLRVINLGKGFSTQEFIPIYSLSPSMVIKIINAYTQEKDNKRDYEFLSNQKLISSKITTFSRLDRIFITRTLLRCINVIFEENFVNTNEKDVKLIISNIIFDSELILPVIDEIFDLEMKKEVELEYYYFIYGVKVSQDIVDFDRELTQIMVVPQEKDREILSVSLNLFNNNFTESHRGYTNLVRNATGWIKSKFRIPINELESKDIYKNIHMKPPEFFNEALFLLGYTNARVFFYSQTSVNSEISYGFDIHNGYYQGGMPASLPNWQRNEAVRRFHIDENVVLGENDISLIAKYVTFRFKNEKNIHLELYYGRFSRLILSRTFFDFILEASIILEAFLVNKGELIARTLRKRVSIIIGDSKKNIKVLKNFIFKFYEIRSEIVHSGKFDLRNDFIEYSKFGDIRTFIIDIVRLVLLRFLIINNELRLVSKENRTTMIENLIEGNSIRIPPSILFKKFQKKFLLILEN